MSGKKCFSTHSSKTTGPIAEIQTVLESSHRGEGPNICINNFFSLGTFFNVWEIFEVVFFTLLLWVEGWRGGWRRENQCKAGWGH
jgi:hypothetical protein